MIEEFLQTVGIYYKTHGTNVGRGNVAVACLWHDDVSQHLNITIESPYIATCWVCGKIANLGELRHALTAKGYDCSSLAHGGVYYKPPAKLAKTYDVNFIKDLPKTSSVWQWVTEMPHNISDVYRDRWIPREKLELLECFDGQRSWAGYFIFKIGDFYCGRLYNSKIEGARWRKYGKIDRLFMGEFCSDTYGVGYVVEGIFDCLRFPIGEAVALLSNHANLSTVKMIDETFKNASEICIALDSDVAAANIKSLKNMLEALGRKVTIFDRALLDGCKDIDEWCIKNNTQEYLTFDGLL